MCSHYFQISSKYRDRWQLDLIICYFCYVNCIKIFDFLFKVERSLINKRKKNSEL